MMRRKIFNDILEHCSKKQISIIVGARQVGKTTVLHQIKEHIEGQGENPSYFTSLEDPSILKTLDEHPNNLFLVIPPLTESKRVFVFIDEIQYLSNPSNFLKYHYDKYQDRIKFIVTGSSSFYIDEKFKDSLAGRKRIFQMPTLSFAEMLAFREKADLLEFLNTGNNLPAVFSDDMQNLFHEYLLFGGYPDVVLENDISEKKKIISEIAESYVKKDAVEARLKHPEAYLLLMKILSSQIGNLLNVSHIGSGFEIKRISVEEYVRIMRKSFHVTLVRPFHRNLVKELRKMPKVFFNDLGLRNHFAGNFEPIGLRPDKGELFENYVFRALLDKYGEDSIRFWRTQKGQEVDFIVEENKAYEVKFSESQFNPNKYGYFNEKYPKIPLSLIHYKNVLKIDF